MHPHLYGAAFASLALLTPHLWHLYAVFLVLGIVGNGTTQLSYARVVSTWFDRNRGQALAAVMAGSGVGSMIFPPLAQALISRFGWRCAYALMGAAVLCISVPLVTLFLYEPANRHTAAQPTANLRSRGSMWSGTFMGIAAALFLFSFATNGLNTHWAAFLSDSGATPSRAAMVLSVAGFAALCGKLGTGHLLDRFRAGRVAALLLVASGIGFGLMLVPYQWPLALTSATLIGIGMGAESDVVPFLLTRYFGLERFGVLYGYTWLVYAVAGATGPLVMGSVFDRSGSYRAVLMASLGMVLIASLIFSLLPSYKSPEQSV